MSQTLREIAEQLRASDKKVQLIYAFNGSGKTRLSREFKELVSPKSAAETDNDEDHKSKILYYNAFTEDLYYWDNDLEKDTKRKLKIQPNAYTFWILQDQGLDQNIIAYFQLHTGNKLTPHFNQEYTTQDQQGNQIMVKAFSEVTFSYERGNEEPREYVKISKGEESVFIWSIFYNLIEQVIGILNIPEESERDTDSYNELQYVFIDDPVSSLDDNHLIELTVNIAELIKSSESGLKFIITTHNPLFYNVLYNELGLKKGTKKEGCYLLESLEDGTFNLEVKYGDSNKSFSYHLYLKETIKAAIEANKVERYHFTLLRNLYEKTASFLGYPRWSELLPDDKETYYRRVVQFANHNTLSNEAVAQPSDPEKNTVGVLFNHLIENYSYWQEESAS
ncbi:anticodon nuclease [Verrucomicrobia bacterium S94]|nr:anticodon nuclease [Verrucomicrobia bacterium S94]